MYSCLYLPQQDEGLNLLYIQFSRHLESNEINHNFLRGYLQRNDVDSKITMDNLRLPLGRI